MTDVNEELIYTLEYIIDKGNLTAPNLTEISVYKLLFLSYIQLKKIGIDLKLPYSWYIHGTMIEASGFQNSTGLTLGNYFCEDNSAYNYYNKRQNLDIDRQTKAKIEAVADLLIDTYSTPAGWNISALLTTVYEYAPYPFQRTFKFKLLKRDLNNSSRADIEALLDELKSQYPETDEYAGFYPTYLKWDDTVRLTLDMGCANTEIHAMLEDFWNTFAAKLRTLENENLSEAELGNTYRFFTTKLISYKEKLKDKREQYLSMSDIPYDPSDSEKSLFEDLNRAAYDACITRDSL